MGKWDLKAWLNTLSSSQPRIGTMGIGTFRIGGSRKPRTSQLGIEITPNAIAVAQIDPQKNQLKLEHVENFYGNDLKERTRQLKEFIQSQNSKPTSCNLVLHSSFYRLLLVDAPEVPQEELQEAMRWRIKDLISEPIDKVSIDVILLPSDAYEGRMNMVYVAVAPITQIEAFVEALIEIDLTPKTVDIPELTTRNLSLKISEEKAAAIICIREQGSFVNVITGYQLYLTRNIDVTIDTLHAIADENEQACEQLLMEVQRSLDYYESQLGKGGIDMVIFAPAASRGIQPSIQLLETNLERSITLLDLTSLLHSDNELSLPEQAHALPAIGAAMRGL